MCECACVREGVNENIDELDVSVNVKKLNMKIFFKSQRK